MMKKAISRILIVKQRIPENLMEGCLRMSESELDNQIRKTGHWEKLQKFATENMFVVAAKEYVKSVPEIGSYAAVVEAVLSNILDKKVKENRRILLESLKQASPQYTIGSVSTEDFIMDYMNLQSSVERLRSNEKIQFMANLFVSAHCGNIICNLNEYDEMLQKLNYLSFREIALLDLLHIYGYNSNDFYKHAKQDLNISKEICIGLLTSISQTGFCKEITGAYPGEGDCFVITELYNRFLELIHVEVSGETDEEQTP